MEKLIYSIVVVDALIPHVAREVVVSGRLGSSVRALPRTDNCFTRGSAMSIIAARAEVGVCWRNHRRDDSRARLTQLLKQGTGGWELERCL